MRLSVVFWCINPTYQGTVRNRVLGGFCGSWGLPGISAGDFSGTYFWSVFLSGTRWIQGGAGIFVFGSFPYRVFVVFRGHSRGPPGILLFHHFLLQGLSSSGGAPAVGSGVSSVDRGDSLFPLFICQGALGARVPPGISLLFIMCTSTRWIHGSA